MIAQNLDHISSRSDGSLAAFISALPGRSVWPEQRSPDLPASSLLRTQRPIRRCFFCGTNTVIPRRGESYFLRILPNGRSFNYCRKHWRKLHAYASPFVILYHQRHRLSSRHTVKRTIRELKAEMERIKQFIRHTRS